MRHKTFPLLALLATLAFGVFSASALAATAPADDEVILPSRVANPIHRAELSLDRSEEYVDAGDKVRAVAALKAVRANMARADKAARRQMTAVPADPEAETTPGPDAVIAVLNLDSEIVTNLAGLFDTKQGIIVQGLSPLLFATMNARDKLLAAVIGLDPEGAGADYSDGMADIVTGFDDEVANLTEAIGDDQLSLGGRKVLVAAAAQSRKTQAKVAAAFGGGE
jgi:hypothetical protein